MVSFHKVTIRYPFKNRITHSFPSPSSYYTPIAYLATTPYIAFIAMPRFPPEHVPESQSLITSTSDHHSAVGTHGEI